MKKLLMMTGAVAMMIAAVPTVHAEDAYISTAGNHGRTGATNFIDTAWTVTPQTRVELDYALLEDWDSSLSSVYLFGGSGESPWFTAFINNGYIGFHNGSGWITSIKPAGANTADVRFTAILDNANGTASVMYNGEVVGSVQTAAAASYGTKTLKLASHADLDRLAAIKIYGLRLYEGGDKKRDYTPLVKGGVAGLRDSVTGEFLGGVGLTASANTPVEEDDPYLATTGNSGNHGESLYVDTLWKVTASTRFELDYALIDDFTGSESWYLFGASSEAPWFTAFINGNASASGVGFANGTSGSGANWKTGHLGIGANAKGVRHTAIVDNANNWVGTMTAGLTNSQAAATSAASFQSGTIKIASHVNKKNFAPIKIYGYRIFENGVKLHDYTPMRKGGQLGFKDSVTGAFFADEHTILLTAGGTMPEEQEDGYVATPSGNSAYYIDTEYYATSNTCCMLDCALIDEVTGSAYDSLFCGAGSSYFMAFINPSSGFGGQTYTAVAGIVGINDVNHTNIRRTFVLDAFNKVAYCTTAGLTNGIASVPQSTERQRNKTIKIGAKFDGADNFAALKVYGCKIYEEGVLVRDFRPCVIGPGQDGTTVVGLKDSLTGAFATYPNATTANHLDCGGKIDCPPYVETKRSDKRYIDTGYTVTTSTKVEIDYSPAESRTTGHTWYLFGAGGSANFSAFINNSGFGFINTSGGWKQGVGASVGASVVNVRRTVILDNPAGLGSIITEGVTNATCATAASGTFPISLKLSAPNNPTDHYATIRIYRCRIWEKENGEYVLKRDYVPAVVNGVAGLQDILPNGEFRACASSATTPLTYGGTFTPTVTPAAAKVVKGRNVTLTASAPGATSYRWLKNGNPVVGGTNGTLTVRGRSPTDTPIDTYQAIAIYTVDGLTAESEPSAVVTIENEPMGGIISVR